MSTRRLHLILPLALSLVLAACNSGIVPPPSQPASPTSAPARGVNAPEPQAADGTLEQGGMSDGGVTIQKDQQVHTIDTGPLLIHAPQAWRPRLVIAKCNGQVDFCEQSQAYEIAESVGNLLTTAGATQLWTGLSTAIGTPWNTTNTQFAVGDSSVAAAISQTDLQASLGTKLNAADCTGATNATPIVVTCTFSPTPVVGQVVTLSGFTGAGASAINNTFELSAASASSITLLNSAGTGAITLTGGIVSPVNKYRQQANASGSAVVSTNQIVYVATVGTNNANYIWNEWAMTLGAAATNKQATPPPTMLNRAVTNLGTKSNASSWTATLTLSLT